MASTGRTIGSTRVGPLDPRNQVFLGVLIFSHRLSDYLLRGYDTLACFLFHTQLIMCVRFELICSFCAKSIYPISIQFQSCTRVVGAGQSVEADDLCSVWVGEVIRDLCRGLMRVIGLVFGMGRGGGLSFFSFLFIFLLLVVCPGTWFCFWMCG